MIICFLIILFMDLLFNLFVILLGLGAIGLMLLLPQTIIAALGVGMLMYHLSRD